MGLFFVLMVTIAPLLESRIRSLVRRCIITAFQVLSGHGFNRAGNGVNQDTSLRLQPPFDRLRVVREVDRLRDLPQGLKPGQLSVSCRHG